MKIWICLSVLSVLVAAKPEYHDDVFHFSSLDGLRSLSSFSHKSPSPQPIVAQVHHQIAQPTVYKKIETHHVVHPVVTEVQTHQPVYAHHSRQVERISQPAEFRPRQSGPLVDLTETGSYSQHQQQPFVRILKQVQEMDPLGPYHLDVETENGIKNEERGTLANPGSSSSQEGGVVKRGFYSYTGPNGVEYKVDYVADENGFRASGAHIPAVPAEIQRALEIIDQEGDKYDERGNLIKN